MENNILLGNFKDDVLKDTMKGLRRYKPIENDDGTISLLDVTEYDVIGDTFGAAEVKQIARTIAKGFDKNKILESIDDIAALTEAGYVPDALIATLLLEKFAGCWISFTDEKGNPTTEPYIHWMEEVADEEVAE